MIREGKVAIAFFIAYILLVLTIFHDKHLRYGTSIAWDFAARRAAILGLSLSVTWFVPHSSIAKRSALIGMFLKYLAEYSVKGKGFHFSDYAVRRKYCKST